MKICMLQNEKVKNKEEKEKVVKLFIQPSAIRMCVCVSSVALKYVLKYVGPLLGKQTTVLFLIQRSLNGTPKCN